MTRNAKPGSPRAVDGPMGAPQRFWGDSVKYNGERVEIALYLAVFVTRDRERHVQYPDEIITSIPISGLRRITYGSTATRAYVNYRLK